MLAPHRFRILSPPAIPIPPLLDIVLNSQGEGKERLGLICFQTVIGELHLSTGQTLKSKIDGHLSTFYPEEELDTLIGEKTEKLRSSLLSCNPAGMLSSSLPRQMSLQRHSLCDTPGPPPPVKNPLLEGQQTSCYRAPQGFAQMSPSFVQQLPDGPQTLLPLSETQNKHRLQPGSSQDSPSPAETPPGGHGLKMLTEHAAARTVQDALMTEGDLSNDIDALNPSLTDFDLQGEFPPSRIREMLAQFDRTQHNPKL